jgi:A/G-specific adenine glycosylase
MDKRYFSDKVAEWYALNKRELPWRQTKDPYKIWLSEVILQQTRVIQGTPYYQRFLEKFPTLRHLASASQQEVLRQWQGLGYYTRARNLHKCAQTILAEYGGRFPQSFQELKELPGIGEYTAAAIASISFREPVAVVDGNVYRVLARVFGIDTPINTPEGKKQFFALANDLIDARMPDVFNQAVMEFGALCCTPKNPVCSSCPLRTMCLAAQREMQDQLPVKKNTKKIRHRYVHYFVVRRNKSVLMRKRVEKDIWHGLYDFYSVESSRKNSASRIVQNDRFLKKLAVEIVGSTKTYKHVLSHQVIHASFTYVATRRETVLSGFKYYSFRKVAELPKPILINRYLLEQELLS